MKKITLVLLVSLFVLLITSCKSEIEIPQKKYHTITFNTNGGSSLENLKVESGGLIEKFASPTKDGHLFKEWRTADDVVYDFSTPVTSDITLHAHYYVEAPEDIEKEIYSLFVLMNHLNDWDNEKNKPSEIFGNAGLLEMAYALNGENDGFYSELYLTHDSNRYDLDLENYKIVEKAEAKLSGEITVDGAFNLSFDDIIYSIELEGVGVITSVSFNAKYNGNENKMNIALKSGEKDYPALSLTYSSGGYLIIYGDYFYSHTHSFSEWILSYPATEDEDGKEVRHCLCGTEEERAISKTNVRSIQVTQPCEKTYDGKPIDISQAITFKGEGVPAFEYKALGEEDDMYSTISPKDAGKYVIRITIEANDEYKTKSQLEINYTINKARIYAGVISNLFIEDGREYNAEKQEWKATLGNTEDESCTFVYDNIVLGEKIIVRFISDSPDAGNYYATYNLETAICNVQILGEGETLPSNYDFSINSQAMISKKPLEGSIKIEKIYDRSYNFEATDLSSLSGIVEKDKGRLKLSVLGSYNEVGDERPQVVKDYNLLLDDEVANNYSISKSQIKLEIKPRELSILDLGDTLITPYIEGVNERKIALRPIHGLISWTESIAEGLRYYSDNATLVITPKKDLSIGTSINNNDFELSIDNKNYTIKKENAFKSIEVVEVTKSIDELRSSFSIAPGEYEYCYVDVGTDNGIQVQIEGTEKTKVQAYPVSSNGCHGYSVSQDVVVFSSSLEKTERRYLLLHSVDGASGLNLKTSIVTKIN